MRLPLKPRNGSLIRALAAFAGDRRGVSAVEFALILPLMVALYLGGVEVTQAINADRKVTLTAGALANLTAQASSISSSDMTDILDASSAVMYPYSTGNMTAVISCLSIDAAKKVTVKWSQTLNGQARAAGSSVAIDANLAIANTQLLLSEVSYKYKPAIGYMITGTLNLSDKMYMAPRITAPSYGDGAGAVSCS
ncbi:MAG: TadE/TadG family type IV pilus assembly protein [Pseudolabrys sp.]